jgi:serine protease inhibitor
MAISVSEPMFWDKCIPSKSSVQAMCNSLKECGGRAKRITEIFLSCVALQIARISDVLIAIKCDFFDPVVKRIQNFLGLSEQKAPELPVSQDEGPQSLVSEDKAPQSLVFEQKATQKKPPLVRSSELSLPNVLATQELKQQVKQVIGNLQNLFMKEGVKDGKSFGISTISVVAMLGLILSTATVEQEKNFFEALGLDENTNVDDFHRSLQAILQEIVAEDQGDMVSVTQVLAALSTYRIHDGINTVLGSYRTQKIIEGTSSELRETADACVDELTHRCIKSSGLNDDTAFALLNVVYLKLSWQKEFEKPQDGWKVGDFVLSNRERISNVPMMSRVFKATEAKFFENKNYSILEIPYKVVSEKTFSYLIVLPKEDQNFKMPEFSEIKEYRGQASMHRQVNVTMPRTCIEGESVLTPILNDIGLPISEMGFGTIKQTVFIKTNEKGSEAAAVTGALMPQGCGNLTHFNVNRSYGFYIFNGEDLPIFSGLVNSKEALLMDPNE